MPISEEKRRRQVAEVEDWKRRANRLAAIATVWFVAPFALALGFVAWSRYDRTHAAIDHLTSVARVLSARQEQCAQRPAAEGEKGRADEAIEDRWSRCRGEAVKQLVEEQHPVRPDPSGADARAAVVVQTVSSELQRASGEEAPACPRWMLSAVAPRCHPPTDFAPIHRLQVVAAKDLYADALISIGLVLFLLSAVAGLFIADVHRAKRAIVELGAARGGPFAGFESLRAEIAFRRDQHTLERPMFFTRRLGFAFLMGMGANYLLAPLGLMASIAGSFTAYHPAVGASSVAYWVEHAKHASPVAVGFCGFMVYSMLILVQRAMSRDLSDRVFISLLNRGIVVMILSIVMSGVTDSGPMWRVVIFFAGLFPQTGIDALAKVAQLKVSAVTSDATAGFETLPEIDLGKQHTLRELGVNDANDLACADLAALLIEAGIEAGVLLRAADRAILIHTFGVAAAKRLEAIPLYTACDLVAYLSADDRGEERATQVAALLRDEAVEADEGISIQLEQLGGNPNVAYLLEKKEAYRPAPAA